MHTDGSAWTAPVLTPRQDRLEATIVRALRTGGTRSELREAVYELVDLFRLQGIPAARGVALVMQTAARGARTDLPRADRPADAEDWLRLVASWSERRYTRSD